jgi:hypothetical protein
VVAKLDVSGSAEPVERSAREAGGNVEVVLALLVEAGDNCPMGRSCPQTLVSDQLGHHVAVKGVHVGSLFWLVTGA